MKRLGTAFLLIISTLESWAVDQCVPARETVLFPHNGLYHRIHPSGDFFLFSEGDKAVLVDIRDRKKPRKIYSSMREETYPVEAAGGGWDLLASPIGGGSMGSQGGTEYYSFSSLVDGDAKKTRPTYVDKQHGQYYHSSAELPGSTAGKKKVRTVLFEDLIYRDYEMAMAANGKVAQVKASPVDKLCKNLFSKIERPVEVEKKYNAAMNELEEIKEKYKKLDQDPNVDGAKKDALEKEYFDKLDSANREYYGEKFEEFNKANYKVRVLKGEKSQETTQLLREPNVREHFDHHSSTQEKLKEINQKIENSTEIQNARAVIIKNYEELSKAKGEQREKVNKKVQSAIAKYRSILESKKKEYGYEAAATNYRASSAQLDKTLSKYPGWKRITELNLLIDKASVELTDLKYGKQLVNPILSKDGTYVAGLRGGFIQVYKIGKDGSCEELPETNFRGSKVSFSYPEKGRAPKIAFTVEGGPSNGFRTEAYTYDLETKSTQKISSDRDENPYYPGYTLDGRVMFKTDAGMTIVDPNQLEGSTKSCIQKPQVSNSESSQSDEKKGVQ